ncbi:tyrosine-type recombinase/integrase [Dysgonomonas sp. Marseille-P4361]|uniref:tyrosine-type recombinase/integrase n=1 Tax=Dysgonomonas sp. Marseille-P4361 TaxID=2161820 RepID=UPI000D54CD3F|nr:tyrosine-type recombinase/integrase [Dysgonomonas sp. Marseille-P4361]
MNSNIEYKSVLAPFIKEFIALKETIGINTRGNKWILLEIDRFILANNIMEPIITRELIGQWRKTRENDSDGTLQGKYSVWSQLSRFMCRHGYECYVPKQPRYRRSIRPGYAPYIFTRQQMAAILDRSAELKLDKRGNSYVMFCVPAILRLLYSTGLRISEALSIRNSDVRMDKGYIDIRKTKNGCERIVPVNKELESVLQQYLFYRDKMPIKNTFKPDNLFFIRPDGTHCTYQAIYRWFRRIFQQCGIAYSGNRQGPRIHDIRHTMAVHALEQMTRKGIDLYASMPIIATCLGHKTISATEQYVRLTYEMYPELAEQCSAITAFVYPRL